MRAYSADRAGGGNTLLLRGEPKILRASISQVRGALGEIKADLIIRGGKLVNVYSGEILDGMEIAIQGRNIFFEPNGET